MFAYLPHTQEALKTTRKRSKRHRRVCSYGLPDDCCRQLTRGESALYSSEIDLPDFDAVSIRENSDGFLQVARRGPVRYSTKMVSKPQEHLLVEFPSTGLAEKPSATCEGLSSPISPLQRLMTNLSSEVHNSTIYELGRPQGQRKRGRR